RSCHQQSYPHGQDGRLHPGPRPRGPDSAVLRCRSGMGQSRQALDRSRRESGGIRFRGQDRPRLRARSPSCGSRTAATSGRRCQPGGDRGASGAADSEDARCGDSSGQQMRHRAAGRKPRCASGSCAMRVLIVAAAAFASLGGTAAVAQQPLTVVLTGQSMIRSDLRATVPAAVPRIRALLQGDVVFTHLEAAIAENGQSVQQGRGFLTPPESLDALQALGFNLLSLSGNHAFDLGAPGIRNTLQELNRRGIAHAGTGANLADAVAPAYLHVANMTVALIGSASGLITPGGNATAERPGVNELRVDAGGRPNEATAD